MQCAEATAAMVEAFPELRRVRGYAMIVCDMRPHWWCMTPAGDVVDPTAHQWDVPPVFYDELQSDEEPHGKCHSCGGLLYRSHGAEAYWCEFCKQLPHTI